ncbi:MAG: hypothetical protein ACI8RZ_004712 [Myxococcota bacterium]|jgi:hypothetical protein
MQAEVPLTVGVLCAGVMLEAAVRWGPVGMETAEVATIAAEPVSWTEMLPEVTARRTGTPPTLKHKAAENGRRGCRKKIVARNLTMFSDVALAELGVPTVSPIVVLVDGKALNAQPASEPIGSRCLGISAFARSAVVFSPRTEAGAKFALALNPQLPIKTPDGPAWWVYAGSGMALSMAEKAALAGTTLTARVWAKRLPGTSPNAPILSVAGAETTLRDLDGTMVGSLSFIVPEDAWTVAVRSPAGGSHFVVERLTLSDGDRRIELLEAVQ